MVDSQPAERSPNTATIGVTAMMMMVVGSMVGAGVFSLPARFASATGVAGALIAWVIAGAGMLMLAFVFQTLAIRKPHLDAGVYAYAKAGFGEYLGFFLRVRLLGQRVRGKRDLLGVDHVDFGQGGARIR